MAQDSSQQARDDFMNEIENISKKERFGLFTQPPPLSINDDSKARRPQSAQNFRNFSTIPPKKGNYNDALFQNPGFISINDYYKDSFKGQQLYTKEKYDKIPHNQPFKTTHNTKTVIEPPYEYISGTTPKVFTGKDENGNVKTGPRNFYTNMMKSGFGNTTTGHLFSNYQYKVDPYENKESRNLDDLIEHRRKIVNKTKPFCSSSHGKKAFTVDQAIYGFQGFCRKAKTPKFYGMTHAYPFRPNNPAKKGYNKTIGKFPDYMDEPLVRRELKIEVNNKDQPFWRPNYNGTLSKPCAPILKRICSARAKIL